MDLDNILLIGNGFDIGHGYPTSYKEYAEIAQSFISLHDAPWRRNVGGLSNIEKPKYYYLDRFIYEQVDFCEDFYSLIYNNIWQELFDNKFNLLNCSNHWYDLECFVRDELSNANGKIAENPHKAIIDYNRFRRAFEIFVYLFPEYARSRQQEKNELPNRVKRIIESISPKYVINYNYTDTYSRLYSEKTPVDYVHGKATLYIENNNCNIVFGAPDGEYEWSKNVLDCFVKSHQVKKFNIIHKYPEWIKNGNFLLHIYGHSLDSTDKDTLTPIMLSDSIKKIIIWHLSGEDKESKLKETLGQDVCQEISEKIEYREI